MQSVAFYRQKNLESSEFNGHNKNNKDNSFRKVFILKLMLKKLSQTPQISCKCLLINQCDNFLTLKAEILKVPFIKFPVCRVFTLNSS